MLEARNIHYDHAAQAASALRGVSLSVKPGAVVGVFGASGAGKSTLARVLAGHLRATAGAVTIDGAAPPTRGFKPIQLVFQNAETAFNPRWKLGDSLKESWTPDTSVLAAFEISPGLLDRFPCEVSGGELQRVALVRAFSPATRFLICDESSAMIDPINQAKIWKSLLTLARSRRCGIIAIAHSRALLEAVSDRMFELNNGVLISQDQARNRA